jgi:hypothetical protein
MTETGCGCAPEGRGGGGRSCACCAPGGCPCLGAGANRCVQCGLEAACGSGQLSILWIFFGIFKVNFPTVLNFQQILYIFLLLTGFYLQVVKDTKNNIFCISFLHFYIYV